MFLGVASILKIYQSGLAITDCIKELELLRSDKGLQSAMLAWGLCRNLKDQCGDVNQGFHAGVIHYFEYHSCPNKSGRFKSDEHTRPQISLKDFIDFSLKSRSKLKDYNPEMQGVRNYAVVQDRHGQERHFIETENQIIVAFKSVSWPLTLLSVMSRQPSSGRAAHFSKLFENELANKEFDQRFNCLGKDRKLVFIYPA